MREQGFRISWEDDTIFAMSSDHRIPDIAWEDTVTGVRYVIDFVTSGAQGRDGDRGGTALLAEQRKVASYETCLREVPGYTLQAFGLDTFGGLGDGARAFLRLLATRRLQAVQRAGDDEADTRLRYLYTQRVVLALLRAQAHVLRRSCQVSGVALEEQLRADSAPRERILDLSQPGDPDGPADLALVSVPDHAC
jgi:hypothetical protein